MLTANKRFLIWFFVLLILEIFLFEKNGAYPFPEAFISLIFLNANDRYIPLKAFFMGLLMDLSSNTLGVFTFSYTAYSILLRIFLEYSMEIEYFKLPVFLVFDILIKATNVAMLYLKSGVGVSLPGLAFSVIVDYLIFIVLDIFYKK